MLSLNKKFLLALIANALLINTPAFSVVTLDNMKEVRAALGLDRYVFNERLAKLKIAVIDNGFLGMDADKKVLPESAQVVLKYDAELIKKFNLGDPAYNEGPAQTEHGRVMAQIAWAATGANPQGPKFYLLNANGITNFRRAVRFAIEEKVDIILYSQNRECCGNFDGGGFLNDIVNQAVSAGILWVNAAGNYGGNVYNGQVGRVSEFHLKSGLDENTAQLILTWNSSGPAEDTGTEKDLDLLIYDETGKEVAKSVLKQVLKKDKLGDGETFLPRERIRFEFAKNKTGTYKVVVKDKSRNFSESDRIRLVLIPEKQPFFDQNENKQVNAISLVEATQGGEIMVPADNPGVITVGELSPSSAKGVMPDGHQKPEVVLENSIATFTNGTSSTGTSNAAAYFAGIVAVLKSYRPGITRNEIIAFPRRRPVSIQKISLSEFAMMQRKILTIIEDISNESPLQAGRYPDGHYVLGVSKNPSELLQPVCGKTNPQGFEFFLAITKPPQNKVLCFTRDLGGKGKEAEGYPWQDNENDRHAWVEIRQVYRTGAQNTNDGTWMTPSPEQLNPSNQL